MTSLPDDEAQLLILILELSGADTKKILNRAAVSSARGKSPGAGKSLLKRLTARRLIRYIFFGSLCITEAGIVAGRACKPKRKAEIFLSYRRSDTQDIVDRMFDRLAADFGRESIFQDLNSGIPGGAKFADYLRHTAANCAVVLVIIGPTWLEAAGPQSRPRLFEENNLLRAEIETALSGDCILIPVCVGGAQPPKEESLPMSIKALSDNHALEVRRGGDFHADMTKLVEAISTR